MGAFGDGSYAEDGGCWLLRDLEPLGSSERELMAQVIAEAERRLAAEPRPAETDGEPVIAAAEVATVEVSLSS